MKFTLCVACGGRKSTYTSPQQKTRRGIWIYFHSVGDGWQSTEQSRFSSQGMHLSKLSVHASWCRITELGNFMEHRNTSWGIKYSLRSKVCITPHIEKTFSFLYFSLFQQSIPKSIQLNNCTSWNAIGKERRGKEWYCTMSSTPSSLQSPNLYSYSYKRVLQLQGQFFHG